MSTSTNGHSTYIKRKDELETYFDRTAASAWEKLTSDAPVGRIRATVRAGRSAMHDVLMGWLPQDMKGMRLLDAGCGTGTLAVEVAKRGAHVVAIDVSATLIDLARDRAKEAGRGSIDFRVGDMLDPGLGQFDHVIAMDSLIHYETRDIASAIGTLAKRTSGRIVFTVAPQTALLTVMHKVGRLFPQSDRAPAIVPVSIPRLQTAMQQEAALSHHQMTSTHRISRGFYKSEAVLVEPKNIALRMGGHA